MKFSILQNQKQRMVFAMIYPFFIYLFAGFEKIVQMLIEKEAHINAIDEDSTSALIFAADKGSVLYF